MKSRVKNKALFVLALIVIIIGLSASSFAQSDTCDCARPPGGIQKCEGGLIPVCVVVNGEKIGSCVQRPLGNTNPRQALLEFQAHILSKILNLTITPEDVEATPAYTEIFQRGGFVVLTGGLGGSTRNEVHISFPGSPASTFNLPIFRNMEQLRPAINTTLPSEQPNIRRRDIRTDDIKLIKVQKTTRGIG